MRRRWTRASRLFLLSSLALALVAGLLAHGYVARAGAAAAAAGARVPVVVAASGIARGALLRTSQLKVVRMPRAFAPPGAFRDIPRAAGRAALTDLAAGEAVTETRLARVRAGPVASLVPQGLRAFAVPTSLPPGAVRPGDHVDILATYGANGGGQPHTETVVEGVEILLALGPGAPGPQSGSGLGLDVGAAGAGSSVTLVVLVAPDDEGRLAYARAFADLEVAIVPT